MNSNEAPRPSTPKQMRFVEILLRWLATARFFTFSALLHMLLVIAIGSTAVYKHFADAPDFAAAPGGLVAEAGDVPPPAADESFDLRPTEYSPSTDSSSAQSTSSVPSSSAASALVRVSSGAPAFSTTSLRSPATQLPTQSSKSIEPLRSASSINGLGTEMAKRIGAFSGAWARGGTATQSMPLKSRKFEFTAYLAKYQGGDWDSTVWLEKDGSIRGGSLFNLLYLMSHLSKKKISADPQPVPLDLSSGEIFQKKPPFIWFTGHRDFTLTDQELINLAQYLRSGGCIWGDSSSPGRRSRFDIAFRREMKRILPELDQQWEALPTSHPIFTSAYFPEIREVVPGMNFYHEPIYALRGFANEIAVIYTANDYGDMWQFGLDENNEFDMSRDDKRRFVAINEEMWHRRNLYFRNIEPRSVLDTYKFGTNIIIHLVTRWENHVRLAPRAASNGNL